MKIKSLLYYVIIFILPFTIAALLVNNNIVEVQSGWKKEFYFHHINNYNKIINTEDYITENQRKIDILHYDLIFDLFPDEKKFDASAVILGVVKEEGLKTLELNFYDNFDMVNNEISNSETASELKEIVLSLNN